MRSIERMGLRVKLRSVPTVWASIGQNRVRSSCGLATLARGPGGNRNDSSGYADQVTIDENNGDSKPQGLAAVDLTER